MEKAMAIAKSSSPTGTSVMSPKEEAPSSSPTSSLRTRMQSPHFRSHHIGGDHQHLGRSPTVFTPVANTFGPILTPSGRNSSMVLLSPSRTLSKSLISLASTTAQQLESVWEEIGYTSEERASQLNDLLTKFEESCDNKIAEEQGVAQTFRQTIAEAKKEIRGTSKALNIPVDSHLLIESGGQALNDELAALESSLEGLRFEASSAKEDLQRCHHQIVEAHNALGIKLHHKWNDLESDLTAARREEFHRKADEMKEQLTARTSAVIELLCVCQKLIDHLAIDPEETGNDLDCRIAGSLVLSKDGSHIMASKFRTKTCIGLSSSSLNELTRRIGELEQEKNKRKLKMSEIGAEICTLWEKLRIPDEEKLAFKESVNGLGMETIKKGEAELERLKDLKAGMLGKLVREARETIRALWEQTNVTEDLRQSFTPMKVQDEALFDDELLEKHETYIATLEEKLEQMKPILKLIERRNDILRDRMEYAELQSNSARLQERGPSMTKQLMREEKMNRRIKRDLPRLTKMLQTTLREFRKTHGEDFTCNGEVYLVTMEKQEDEFFHFKETLKSAKNEASENRSHQANHHKMQRGSKDDIPTCTRPLNDARSRDNTRAASRLRG